MTATSKALDAVHELNASDVVHTIWECGVCDGLSRALGTDEPYECAHCGNGWLFEVAR